MSSSQSASTDASSSASGEELNTRTSESADGVTSGSDGGPGALQAKGTQGDLRSADPEAGEAIPVTMTFENLRVVIPAKKNICCRSGGAIADDAVRAGDGYSLSADEQDQPATANGETVLLDGVSGTITASTLTMLLGPSGSGKTVLLDAIAGRLPTALKQSGSVKLNGVEVAVRQYSGYALQDDVLHALSTPRENLKFLAKLQLPRSFTAAERLKRVETVLAALGISHVADTKVGTPGLDRGLSGGERKRAAIAQALVTVPPVLLVDDPTAGLDAATAMSVVKALRDLAHKSKITILSTIAQASSEMYALFDDVICLTSGKIAYAGPTGKAVEHFRSLGFAKPERGVNPADYIVDLLSHRPLPSEKAAAGGTGATSEQEDEIAALAQRAADARIATILAGVAPASAEASSAALSQNQDFLSSADVPRAGGLSILWELTKRNAVLASRNHKATVARVMQSLTTSILFGILFYDLSRGQNGGRDRLGLFFLACIFQLFSGMQGAVTVFLSELAVYRRESHEGVYGPFVYLVAKIACDIPFQLMCTALFAPPVYFLSGLQVEVGKFFLFALIMLLCSMIGSAIGLAFSALTRDADATNALMPIVLIPATLFSGYLLNLDNISVVLSWLRHISVMKYSFLALAISELEGITFSCKASEARDGECPLKTGAELLKTINARRDGGIGFDVGLLFAIYGGFLLLALLGLIQARRK